MKKILIISIIGLILSTIYISKPRAEGFMKYGAVIEKKPAQTSPDNIAMIFYRLAGKIPNFNYLAEQGKAYKNAAIEDKFYVRDRRADELKNIYSLVTNQEPVIVEIKVKLSDYSYSNKGFFIEDFDAGTFFPITSNGVNYALVPIGLIDRQWMKSPDIETSQTIQNFNKATKGKNLSVVLFLIPKYADFSKPMIIENKKYWLMSVRVDKLMLYLPGSPKPIWSSENSKSGEQNEKLQRLLDLRQ